MSYQNKKQSFYRAKSCLAKKVEYIFKEYEADIFIVILLNSKARWYSYQGIHKASFFYLSQATLTI